MKSYFNGSVTVDKFEKVYKDTFRFYIEEAMKNDTTLKVEIYLYTPHEYDSFIYFPDRTWSEPEVDCYPCGYIYKEIIIKNAHLKTPEEIAEIVKNEMQPMLNVLDEALEKYDRMTNKTIRNGVSSYLRTWDM